MGLAAIDCLGQELELIRNDTLRLQHAHSSNAEAASIFVCYAAAFLITDRFN